MNVARRKVCEHSNVECQIFSAKMLIFSQTKNALLRQFSESPDQIVNNIHSINNVVEQFIQIIIFSIIFPGKFKAEHCR